MFHAAGGPLGAHLTYIPDSGVGHRRFWIGGIAYRVSNGHPESRPCSVLLPMKKSASNVPERPVVS